MGHKDEQPTCACLEREIRLYEQTITRLSEIRACCPLKVAVFSVDHDWAARVAQCLTTARVYHVNGQREFPLPDVVIAEEQPAPLLRAAQLVELFDGDRTATATEVETVRQAACQALPAPFKYGARRR
jgi:hypothetical protein